MLTLGGQILLSGPDQSAATQPGVVEIDREEIVGVAFGPISESVDFGDENTLICPGLIDAHLHFAAIRFNRCSGDAFAALAK